MIIQIFPAFEVSPNTMSDSMVDPADSDSSENADEGRGDLHVFSAGDLKFAIFDSDIATIAEWRTPTPLPHAPPAVLGVVSIQGRMLTLLNPTTLLDASDNGNNTGGSIVALRGDEQLALAASNKSDEQLSGVDIVSGSDGTGPGVLGVIKHKEQSIRVLDVKQLFALAIRGHERRRRQF